MGKHWRRRGGIGAVAYTLLLSDLGGADWSLEPDAALLAVPAPTAAWYFRVDGGAWTLIVDDVWPQSSMLIDADLDPGMSMQGKVVLSTGLEVLSNVIVR